MNILFQAIPYTVIVVNVFFLLSSGDFTSDCEMIPQLNIIVDGKTYSGSEVLIEVPASVEMTCISSEPLYLDFEGEMAHRFEDIEKTRYRVNQNNAKYCFAETLKFIAAESATGNYTCKTIGTLKQRSSLTSVFIFANKRTEDKAVGSLLNAGHCITNGREVPDNFHMIIPCVITNPDSKPKLYKSHHDHSCENIRENLDHKAEQHFEYDPKLGFIIDTRKTMDCWTNFICVLGNQTLAVRTIKPAEFRVTPPEATRVYQYQQTDKGNSEFVNYKYYAKMNLICESRTNITFTYSPGLESVKINYYPEEPNKYYMYKSKLVFIGDFATAGTNSTVSCVTTDKGEIYWSWTIIYTDENGHADKTGLFFDEKTQSFLCYSATARPTTPTLKLIHCSNSLDCKIARRFSKNNITNDFPFKVSADGYLCRNQPDSIYSGCKEFPIQLGDKYGMAHCQTGDHYYYNIYYTNLQGRTVTVLGDEKDIIFNEITRTVFVNETISLSCKSSATKFAKGIEIVASICDCDAKRHRDYYDFEKCGHCLIYDYDFPENASFISSENVEHNVIKLDASMRIWTNCIVKLWCRSPILTTKEWTSVDIELTVTEGEYPKIDNFQDEVVKFNENDENKTLKCSATGYPLPKLSWEKDGIQQPSPEAWIYENDSKTSFSILIFHKVSIYVDGKYYCIATNPKGSTRKLYTVIVEQWLPVPTYVLYVLIAGIAAIVPLLVIPWFIRVIRRQKREINKLSKADILHFINGDENLSKKYVDFHDAAQHLPYRQEYEIDVINIEIKDEILGKGNFGLVKLGYFEESGKKIPVAVKTVKSNADILHWKSLLSEIKIMMYIGKHPHIIKMIGAMTKDLQDGKLFIAFELCSNGNLESYLKLCRPVFQNRIIGTEIKISHGKMAYFEVENTSEGTSSQHSQLPTPITTVNLIIWCHEISSGMEYLAEKKVIHGDLAARNVLLTDKLSVKITDFGFARHLHEYANYVSKKSFPVPWKWLSIEAIKDCKFSTQSDIWAYGVTLWEIFSLGEVPYQSFSFNDEFVNIISSGYRMGKPKYATDEIYNIMMKCWNETAKSRPSFQNILQTFKELLDVIVSSEENLEAVQCN